MEKKSREERTKDAVERLSEAEKYAYDLWCGTSKPQLSPTLNAKFFNLYLNGKSCNEIRRLNPQYSLGEVVSARIEGEWDRRRDEHLDELLKGTSSRLNQVTLETAEFVCDLLAVAHKEHGDKLKRYLQTGNEEDLGSLRIHTLKGLKEGIELLQKLSGQELDVLLKARESLVKETETEERPVEGAPSSSEAGTALRLLLGRKEG